LIFKAAWRQQDWPTWPRTARPWPSRTGPHRHTGQSESGRRWAGSSAGSVASPCGPTVALRKRWVPGAGARPAGIGAHTAEPEPPSRGAERSCCEPWLDPHPAHRVNAVGCHRAHSAAVAVSPGSAGRPPPTAQQLPQPPAPQPGAAAPRGFAPAYAESDDHPSRASCNKSIHTSCRGPERRQAARLTAGGTGARPGSRGDCLWGLWPAAVRDWQRK
jgi:hypothetical protein